MTPNCGSIIWKHRQGYEEVFIEELHNSRKVRNVVAIYKTNNLPKRKYLKH